MPPDLYDRWDFCKDLKLGKPTGEQDYLILFFEREWGTGQRCFWDKQMSNTVITFAKRSTLSHTHFFCVLPLIHNGIKDSRAHHILQKLNGSFQTVLNLDIAYLTLQVNNGNAKALKFWKCECLKECNYTKTMHKPYFCVFEYCQFRSWLQQPCSVI